MYQKLFLININCLCLAINFSKQQFSRALQLAVFSDVNFHWHSASGPVLVPRCDSLWSHVAAWRAWQYPAGIADQVLHNSSCKMKWAYLVCCASFSANYVGEKGSCRVISAPWWSHLTLFFLWWLPFSPVGCCETHTEPLFGNLAWSHALLPPWSFCLSFLTT